LVQNFEGNRTIEGPRRRWENNIKINLKQGGGLLDLSGSG
jgi:hypothetical protein